MLRRNLKPAFTLVELLVVIGIIALLISVLLPALSKARKQATSLQCLSNLRQCGLAMMMYSQANKGLLPYPTTTLGEASLWFAAIDPYLSSLADSSRGTGVASDRAYTAYKQCPLVNNQFGLTTSNGSGDGGTGAQNTTTEYARSYKMNSYLRHNSPYSQAKISQVRDSSEFVMLGDGISMDYTGYYPSAYDNGQFSFDCNYSPIGTPSASPPALRHSGGCNLMFVDGHAEHIVLPTMTRTLAAPGTVVQTFQTEYLDASGNPAYLATTGSPNTFASADSQGLHRNPKNPLHWSDLPNLSR